MKTMLPLAVQTWSGLSTKMRMLVFVLPVVFAALSFAVATFVLPHNIALFATALDAEQLRQVDAQLAAWNIAHVTTADNFEIDAGARNTILLRLSLAGLPRTHIATSDETLAKVSSLTPDALLEAQSRAGLAGDIAVALRGISGIADASVVIAPARTATFTDEDSSAASASVRLSLRPGAVLSDEAISGIRAFVSSAVPFLARERVVLLDDHGLALGGHEAREGEAETTRVALQSAFDAAFGQGTTIVRVHTVYVQRTQQSHDVERLPAGNTALAVQNSDERFRGKDKQYSKHDQTEDRGSVVHDHESRIDAGSFDHLSVAVLVDQTRGIDLEKIRGVAAAATGIDANDGEHVRVEAVNFVHARDPIAAAGFIWLAPLLLYLPYLFATLVLTLVFAFIRKPFLTLCAAAIERERLRGTRQITAGIAPHDVVGVLAGEPAHTAAAVISALPTVTAAAVLDLYPSEERGAIVARMAKQASVFAPTWDELRRGR